MGFSTLVAWVGVFIILMAALLSLMNVYNTHLTDMQTFFSYEKEVGERYRTNFEIGSTDYAFGNLEVQVANIGRTTIPTKDNFGGTCFDVYIDSSKVESPSLTFDVMNKTWDPLLWDPDEWMNVSLKKSFRPGEHTITLVDCGGLKKTSTVTIPHVSFVGFVPPTETDGTIISQSWAYANASLNSSDLDTVKFNWNGVDYNFYDGSLVLAENFNNNNLIGDSSTEAADISKYNNSGTCYDDSTPMCFWSNQGKFGGSLQLNGVNDYVDFDSPDSFNLDNAFTVEAWVYNHGTGLDESIVSKQTFASFQGYSLKIAANGSIGFSLGDGNEIASLWTNDSYLVPRDTWTHIAGVWDGSTIRIYINGVSAGEENFSGPFVNSDSHLVVGKAADSAGEYFSGSVDELRIYSRALNSSEISMQYQSEFSRFDSGEYNLYVEVNNLSSGSYTYFVWANETTGRRGETDDGFPRYLIVSL